MLLLKEYPKELTHQNFYAVCLCFRSKKDRKMYIGCTQDLQKRLQLHNNGKVTATKDRRPLNLIYYEAFVNQKDAFMREQWLKTGWGRNHLRKILFNHLTSLGR